MLTNSQGAHPIGSEPWMKMADSLGRIGNITEMVCHISIPIEIYLPSSKEQSLPKDQDDATLWECEELALRYLLEDGKLNLYTLPRPA